MVLEYNSRHHPPPIEIILMQVRVKNDVLEELSMQTDNLNLYRSLQTGCIMLPLPPHV